MSAVQGDHRIWLFILVSKQVARLNHLDGEHALLEIFLNFIWRTGVYVLQLNLERGVLVLSLPRALLLFVASAKVFEARLHRLLFRILMPLGDFVEARQDFFSRVSISRVEVLERTFAHVKRRIDEGQFNHDGSLCVGNVSAHD